MPRCPTYVVRNVRTSEKRVINQSSYHSPFRNGDSRYGSVLGGLGDWEIISENHSGGDEGFNKSEQNIDIMVGLEMKREKDRLGERK